MKRYDVSVLIIGSMWVSVEAESFSDAANAGLVAAQEYLATVKFPDSSSAEIGGLDAVSKITSGNVFHGPLNKIEVDESK